MASTNFAGAGRAFGEAATFWAEQQEKKNKQKLLNDWIQKQRARASGAAAASPLISPTAGAMQGLPFEQPPGGMAMPAELGMGMPDTTAPPPDLSSLLDEGGLPMIGGGIDERMAPPITAGMSPIASRAGAPASSLNDLLNPRAVQPMEEEPDESLNMILDLGEQGLIPPDKIFDYIASTGKLNKQLEGRLRIEDTKKALKEMIEEGTMKRFLLGEEGKTTRTETMQEGMGDRLAQTLKSREEIEEENRLMRETIAKITAEAKVKAAGVAAGSGGKLPALGSLETPALFAEFDVYRNRVDSLGRAGMDPTKVGRKDAMKQGFRIDESARQKDLSKASDRLTAIQAEMKKRGLIRGLGMEPAEAPAGPPEGAYVYPNISSMKRAMRKGKIKTPTVWAINENGLPEEFVAE